MQVGWEGGRKEGREIKGGGVEEEKWSCLGRDTYKKNSVRECVKETDATGVCVCAWAVKMKGKESECVFVDVCVKKTGTASEKSEEKEWKSRADRATCHNQALAFYRTFDLECNPILEQ